MPVLTLFGGANGAGKSAFALQLALETGTPYLGADAIAAELNPENPNAARVAAGRIFFERLFAHIDKRQDVIVESTLSGKSLVRHLERAKAAGFEIDLIFLYLPSAELHVQRVAVRVQKGGHDVPEADIRRRVIRSPRNFWQLFRPLADRWKLFENTGLPASLIAEGTPHQTSVRQADGFTAFLEKVGEPPTVQEDTPSVSRYETEQDLKRQIAALEDTIHLLLVFQRAIDKARRENRRLGLPNWTYRDGRVVDDDQVPGDTSAEK